MSRIDGRLSALEALIEQTPIPLECNEYPDEVILPGYVHQRALKAVELTIKDSRERGIQFNYWGTRWRGGIALRGPINSGSKGARVGRTHHMSSLLTRPHLNFHTHPRSNEQHLNQFIDAQRKRGIADESQFEEEMQAMYAEWQGTYMLPSGGDVGVALTNDSKSIGRLISSEGGNFLYVLSKSGLRLVNGMNNVSAVDQLFHSLDKEKELDLARSEVYMASPIPQDAASICANLTVTVLKPDYICYFSEDVENPCLRKLS